MVKKLYKSDDKVISGVLGGVGEYFDIDPTLVRLGYVIVAIATAIVPAIVGYIVAAIIVPQKTPYQAKEATYTEAPKAEPKPDGPKSETV